MSSKKAAVGRWICIYSAVIVLIIGISGAVEAGDLKTLDITSDSARAFQVYTKTDNRKTVKWNSGIHRFVVRVYAKKLKKGKIVTSKCTGVLVRGGAKVLTAAHCLQGVVDAHDVIIQTADGRRHRARRVYWSREFKGNDYEFISDDFGVIELRQNAGLGAALLGYKLWEGEFKKINLVAFHWDKPGLLQREQCEAEFVYSNFRSDRIRHWCVSTSGSSGGPVFVNFHGKLYVAGIQSFMDCDNGHAAYLGAHDETTKFIDRHLVSRKSVSSKQEWKHQLYIDNRRF